MTWKVRNKSNGSVKVSVAKTNTITVGLVLEAGQFCICDGRMTSALDAQERRSLIEIDRNYVNDYKLELAVVHSEGDLSKAIESAKEYTKDFSETSEIPESEHPSDNVEM